MVFILKPPRFSMKQRLENTGLYTKKGEHDGLALLYLCWYQKINYFLLYRYLITTLRGVHQSAVNPYQRMWSLQYIHFASAIRMHATMVEKLASHKEIEALEKLGYLWMINYRYIEQAIIRHRIGCLSITRGITDTHRHDTTLDDIFVDLNVHLIVETLEYHQHEGRDEREGART